MKNILTALIIVLYFLTGQSFVAKAQKQFADHYNFTYITMNDGLESNSVKDLLKDSRGFLWVATAGGGLSRYDGYDFVHYTIHTPGCKLRSNFINNICQDSFSRLWVTSESGIDIIDLATHCTVIPTDPTGKLANIISKSTLRAMCDSKGGIWIFSQPTLFRIEFDKNGNIEKIRTLPAAMAPGPDIAMSDIDNDGCIWVDAGNEIRKFIMEGRVPINFIGSLTYDSINSGVWIEANQGIYFYDLQAERLISLLGGDTPERILGCVGSAIDKNGQLWIGSMEGVYIVDLYSRSADKNSFKYRHLLYKLDQPESKIIEKITCLCLADDGALWLGSNGYGIYKCTKDGNGKETFTAYTTADGLPNNSIRGILQDRNGLLWISTNYGLSCYNTFTNRFSNYTTEDGLIDNQFYWNASCRSASGTLFFGGISGMVSIEGKQDDSITPSVVRLTRLKVENKEIEPCSKYISEDISTCRTLHLHERDKSFLVEFSALNFNSRATAVYSYRLVGFNNQWVNVPASQRFANYTNLPSGTYTFQVKYIAEGATGEEPVTELQIIVKPFFYKTAWFILLMVALVSLIVWQLYQWRIRSLKAQLIRMDRKVQEATADKLSFFTNITHEFRTPITLIIGPIERALKLSYNPQVIEQLHFVERNSKYLLSLINQLMDFRKVESEKMELVKTGGNILTFVDSLIIPFIAFAGERQIIVNQYVHLKYSYFLFDEEALRKVLTNLLSNAIKFTPNGGKVSIYITAIRRQEKGKEELYICVSDTGSGIAEEDIARIFDRFYQSHNAVKYPVYGQSGTGIGLYLCKRIVELHGGEISARNNRGAGCSFRILLPLQQVEEPIEQKLPVVEIRQNKDESETFSSQVRGKLTILVVEDHTDMRNYIRSILNPQYNVIEAANGAEALALLNNHAVDFIVSDLMMPVMDGIELSRQVKENFAISHIPFLMLTAKTSNEAQLESFRTGVDEYLLKPFDETLLLTRIENILENRRRYQRKFSLDMNIDTLPIDKESSDKKFLNRLMEAVKQNYRNSYFEVGGFTEALGVSKSLLNKKLQNLTGQSAGQFMRNYRLNIARELILKNRETKNMNISEIAYEVGFNDPKYFTRCFTKHFNVTPSGLMEG